METEVLPVEEDIFKEDAEGRRETLHALNKKAQQAGLWTPHLPPEFGGLGLGILGMAALFREMGRSMVGPKVFHCDAPDQGNMDLLLAAGSTEQKEKYLRPLVEAKITSAFCMTEPDVASSDATNMAATALVDGDDVVLNGTKWWSTGIGHPNCKVAIFMGLSQPDAPRHQRHSMVLVPLDTPGVKIEKMLSVFGHYDEPFGHGLVSFTDVRLPKSAIILGPGRGFEIAQGRLGPGRGHHCMRAIGAAERALEMLITRACSRTAFGKPIVNLGGNRDIIADARIAIEQARLLTLKTAWTLDTQGIMGAISEVSQIKVVVPNMLQKIADQAMQIHGAAGVSDELPLANLFAGARSLRIADGPDEVHQRTVGRLELQKHAQP